MLNRLLSHLPDFTIDEVMTGTHEFEPGAGPEGAHPFEFRIRWGMDGLAGTVTAGGLCEAAPCSGTIELRYLIDKKIRYSFDFVVDGARYHYIGEKVNIRPWNLPVSHTTCFGTLTDDSEKLISRSVTFFRLRTAPAFLASFKLHTT